MMETMKEIIQAAIKALEEQQSNIKNNSSIYQHEEELQSLQDYNNVLNVELSVIKEILNDLDCTEEEKLVIYKFISSIKTLLELNKTKNTTFTISPQQISYLKMFLDKIRDKKAEIELDTEEQNDNLNKRINS